MAQRMKPSSARSKFSGSSVDSNYNSVCIKKQKLKIQLKQKTNNLKSKQSCGSKDAAASHLV